MATLLITVETDDENIEGFKTWDTDDVINFFSGVGDGQIFGVFEITEKENDNEKNY